MKNKIKVVSSCDSVKLLKISAYIFMAIFTLSAFIFLVVMLGINIDTEFNISYFVCFISSVILAIFIPALIFGFADLITNSHAKNIILAHNYENIEIISEEKNKIISEEDINSNF